MNDDLTTKRKRLRFRSWHRGTKELDLLLGRFAERYLDGFGPQELDQYEALLGETDPDLYNWACGKETPPDDRRTPVLELYLNFKFYE